MNRAIMTATICLSLTIWLGAHTIYTTKITWSRDVSRIMYKHCGFCHHQGGAAFSLMTYKEVRPWAEAIKQQVLGRRMPPWNAVKGFGEFQNDTSLTQEDLEIIGEWINGGAPEGNPFYMPPPPDFHDKPVEPHEAARRLPIIGMKVVRQTITVIGVEPNLLPDTNTLQVVAHRPDGAIDPLLWIKEFNPEFKQIYYFRKPIYFPAGTKIEVTPRTAGITLVLE
jgi:hypothetical protein